MATSAVPRSPGVSTRHRYLPRGRNQLHTVFERHFNELCDLYHERYATTYGMFRLDRIGHILAHLVKIGRALPGRFPDGHADLVGGYDTVGSAIGLVVSDSGGESGHRMGR